MFLENVMITVMTDHNHEIQKKVTHTAGRRKKRNAHSAQCPQGEEGAELQTFEMFSRELFE